MLKWLTRSSTVLSPIYQGALHAISIQLILQLMFTTPVQFIAGGKFYIGAWKALTHGGANMVHFNLKEAQQVSCILMLCISVIRQDVLVSLGTSASYFYSLFSLAMCFFSPHYHPFVFFETSAMLITFILLGKYLEYVAKGRTSEAIKKLMSLQVQLSLIF